MKNVKTLLASLAVCGFVAAGAAIAQESKPSKPAKQAEKTTEPGKDDKEHAHKHDHAHDHGVHIGDVAPAFTATDTAGKTVNLADYKGKVVVLQWFNPQCPAVKQHYEKGASTFNSLYTTYHAKGVEFLAINSGAKGEQGHGADLNATAKKDWKIEYPVLLDESGTIGKSYGATNTPHMFVIDAEGKVAYMGAIDNGNFNKNGDKNYVANALDEILKGTAVTEPETKAYGCGVKYGKNKK